jgi:hypothetical protein
MALPPAALLAIAAAVALGAAIQVRDGLYEPRGFAALTIALAATATAFFIPSRSPSIHRWTQGLLAIALAFNFIQLFTYNHPGSWHAYDDGQLRATRFYHALLTAAAVLAAGMIWRPHLARPLLLALAIVICLIGGWVIRSVRQPYMDVWMLQTEGLKTFVHDHHNPYAAVFPDIYHRPALYAPGTLRSDGLVHQGFPYPPMAFWMELPGYLIGGDYRWSNLAAIALSALLISFCGAGFQPASSTLAPLAAAVFLTAPRTFFILESGWTEPLTLLLLCATIFCALRFPRLMPIALGLFLCSKQYLLWAIPPVILLAGSPLNLARLTRILAIAFLTGCAVSLPLILWDPKAFIAASFSIADAATFRTDALSYLALWAAITHHIPTAGAATMIGFTTAALATLLALARAPRTPAGYALAVAFAHLVFFAFYKFAFCNYYYLLVGALCAAAGAAAAAAAMRSKSQAST